MSAPEGARCNITEPKKLASVVIIKERGEKTTHLRKGSFTVKLPSLKVTSVMNHNGEAHYELDPQCVKSKLERIWQFLSVMLEVTNNNEKTIKKSLLFQVV